MKPLKIEQEDLIEAINNGQSYIQVGSKKYLLVEVKDTDDNDGYEVSDPVEKLKLLEALNYYNPILSEEEIDKMLRS